MTMPLVSGEFGVTADPEVRFTNSGAAMTNIRAVFNDRRRDQSGQWQDGPPQFIDIVVFGKPGENIVESICKGDRIIVSNATLEHQTWEKDGQKFSRHRLFVSVNGSIGVSTRFDPAMSRRALESGSKGVAAATAGLGAAPLGDPWATSPQSQAATQAALDDPWAAQTDEPPF